MEITLSEFISRIGDAAASELFDSPVRTIASWRRGERKPMPDKAQQIIRATANHELGTLTYIGIYQ